MQTRLYKLWFFVKKLPRIQLKDKNETEENIWKLEEILEKEYVCVYVYIYMHIYVYIYMGPYDAQQRIWGNMRKRICVFTKKNICIYVYTHVCVYIYIYTHTYMCIYIHTHTYVCVYIHTHTHTYIWVPMMHSRNWPNTVNQLYSN